MHKADAKNGLVVLTVTMDLASKNDKERASARAEVEKFLAKLAPPFRTVNLQVDPEKVPPTLNFGGAVPGGFVFNRENQWVLKLPEINDKGEEVKEFEYEAVDAAVREALKKK
jgi:hypothetical protein